MKATKENALGAMEVLDRVEMEIDNDGLRTYFRTVKEFLQATHEVLPTEAELEEAEPIQLNKTCRFTPNRSSCL